MESSNVFIDDYVNFTQVFYDENGNRLVEDGELIETVNVDNIPNLSKQVQNTDTGGGENEIQGTKEPSAIAKRNHPSDLIIFNLDDSMVARRRQVTIAQFFCYTS